MHIDHDNLVLVTESDVEQKVVMPILCGDIFLEIPSDKIFTKSYLAPTQLDKAAGRSSGYFPDYTVWMRGFPVLVVEAKAPDVPSETGYREACLYARDLNQAYAPDFNPCRFVLSTNGRSILFGCWDSSPLEVLSVSNLRLGSRELVELRKRCNAGALEAFALECLKRVRSERTTYPYDFAGGAALLKARRPVNTFAAELSPILTRYFSSSTPENSRDIIERAYVSSAEVTEYDRILEALLKERLSGRTDTIVQELEPGRRAEPHVARAISDFSESRPVGGQLQIVQGAVGSGKSLFTRRYKEVLQSPILAKQTRWSFVDFNASPPSLLRAEKWLCSSFVEDFQRENPSMDLSSEGVLRGIYSRNILKRKPIYKELANTSAEQAAVLKAQDMSKWQDDPEETARGIAEYVLGSRKEILIAVMDNVDRLDLEGQLQAFQLALWFMKLTRCFVILQMRDETYERYKNQPPLDTFRTGISFHISPPRFVDVVKKRLELSIEFLQAQAQSRLQSYQVESGIRITYPKSELEVFLHELYVEIFDRKRNISRLLEAIAGNDVRRALEMFVSVITSGHLSETAITSTVLGGRKTPIAEWTLLKILMRTGYRFFSDNSGFISNIFTFDPDWQKPDNFLLCEALWFLATNRKRTGEIGLEGYFTCRHVAVELQKLGYVPEDVLAALNLLLNRKLISADHMNFQNVGFDDSVQILASGYMHVRILSGRIEYLFGVIATTPILDATVSAQLADFVKNESIRGELGGYQKVRAVEFFYKYLTRQSQANATPFSALQGTGAGYVLKQIAGALQYGRNVTLPISNEPDPLDF
jgi:hypothetical protein